jgi:hypothetical protein
VIAVRKNNVTQTVHGICLAVAWSALGPHSVRTWLGSCFALASHLLGTSSALGSHLLRTWVGFDALWVRTWAALASHLFGTWSALAAHSLRTRGLSARREAIVPPRPPNIGFIVSGKGRGRHHTKLT